jgi:5-oxoprolinase (ATP-hydrolysing) subunit B
LKQSISGREGIVAVSGLENQGGNLRIMPAGDAALVVEFGQAVDPAINERVLALDRALGKRAHPAIRETVPTYRSILVYYDPCVSNLSELSAVVVAALNEPDTSREVGRHWRVPVVYGGEFGIDLADIAGRVGVTEAEVIRRHSVVTYRVYMLGFLPGFSYLGGLDPTLATPRRNDPRLITPAGTISIGGIQAGIQCLEAPSGWHLLGRTPVRTYHPTRKPMFLIEPGDAVTFYPIAPENWGKLDAAAAAGEVIAEQL